MPRLIIYGGLVFLLVFLYVYGFYKGVGSEAFDIFQSPSLYSEFEEQTGRTAEATLLGDLGRADVQAFILYRLNMPDRDYEYAWGRTYLGDISFLIPRSFWPGRPASKVKEATDIQYGTGTYESGKRISSRVYGLAGEAMLNFGPVIVPFMFLILGGVVGTVRRWLTIWMQRGEIWLLLVPVLVNLSFVVLVSDLDNLTFFFVKNGAVPFAVLFICAYKSRPPGQTYQHATSAVSLE